MKVNDQKAYDDWKAKNPDPYGAAIFRYAEAWGEIMEARLGQGEKLEGIAEECSHQADTEGVTGFMHGVAVSILSKCWVHGEELRRWHNLFSQIGSEGEKANKSGGVLNPAMLNVGKK